MTSTDTLRLELQDGLAILSLAQPARGNPFDGAFGRDFKQVASDLLNCAVLLAEVLDSEDALRAGLVDQIVADDKLQDEALALARKLAAGPTVAYGETKRLFMRAGAAQLEAQLEDEALTLARVSATQDAQE